MPTTTIRADSVGPGIRIASAVPDDDWRIAPGVTVRSTDPAGSTNGGVAIRLSATGQDLTVDGAVSAAIVGAWLGGAGTANVLRVSATGQLTGEAGYGALLQGSSVTVNRGLLEGGNAGLALQARSGEAATVVNHGTIRGTDGFGILAYGADGGVTLTNLGLIETTSPRDGAPAFGGGGGADWITNHGTMRGDVFLGGGDDRFDGRGGTVQGDILCSWGDDRVTLSTVTSGVLDGGDGRDVLDLRSSAGVTLGLAPGATAGVLLMGFETVMGSATGGDAIRGSDDNETLSGLGGDDGLWGGGGWDWLRGGAGHDRLDGGWAGDWLQGGAGDDTLAGGWDEDRLTGGAGNDRFRFASPDEGGDAITDFRNRPGDDDAFVLDARAFGLAAGALGAGRFQVRADNAAQDADDRFILDTTHRALWFDPDGSGAADPVLLATLQAGATLTAADILLV